MFSQYFGNIQKEKSKYISIGTVTKFSRFGLLKDRKAQFLLFVSVWSKKIIYNLDSELILHENL